MACCRQATSHYLNQCWNISMPTYGVTRPQWVNTLRPDQKWLPIDLFHKSHNASDKYRTMQHFATEMCTHVHIFVTKCCIMAYGTHAFRDLWNGSICWLFLKCLFVFFFNFHFFEACCCGSNCQWTTLLVQVMNCCRAGDKQLPEPPMTQFTVACITRDHFY